MQAAAIILLALVLPHPTRPAHSHLPHKQVLEHGPCWGKDPVRVARFNSGLDHMSRESQLKAQELGRKTFEVFLAHVARGRMAIVGQIQQQLPSTPPAGSAPSAPHNPNPVTARPWGW